MNHYKKLQLMFGKPLSDDMPLDLKTVVETSKLGPAAPRKPEETEKPFFFITPSRTLH